ncbi:hypothetical protein D3C75_804960 [compost metagenome]
MNVPTFFLVVQNINPWVFIAKPHARHVIVGNFIPLLFSQLVIFRQSQRVMPNRLFNIRSKFPRNSEFLAKFIDGCPGHIAANHLTQLLAIVIIQGITDHAPEAGAAFDLLHALHRLLIPIKAVRSSRTRLRTSVSSV